MGWPFLLSIDCHVNAHSEGIFRIFIPRRVSSINPRASSSLSERRTVSVPMIPYLRAQLSVQAMVPLLVPLYPDARITSTLNAASGNVAHAADSSTVTGICAK